MKDTEILKEIQSFHKELRDYNDSLKSEFHKAHTDVLLKIEKLPRHEDFNGYKSSLSKTIDSLKENISKLFSKVNAVEASLSALNKNIRSEKEFKTDVLEIVNNFVSSEMGQSTIFKTVSKEQMEKEKGHLHKKTYWKEIVIPILGLLFLGGSVWSYILPSKETSNQQVVQQIQGGK